MTTFSEKLAARWAAADSLLCVGLDPDPARFPPDLAGRSDAIYTFCRAIADATADYACAFKPQIAYFAAHRAEDELEALIAHCRRVHPQIPVVLDAKRGDMGATSEQYAREVFERYGADAVTLQPYQGIDAIAPFLAYQGGDVIATVKAGRTAAGAGLLISSSRAILYASRGEDYADAAARAAQATRDQIRAALRA